MAKRVFLLFVTLFTSVTNSLYCVPPCLYYSEGWSIKAIGLNNNKSYLVVSGVKSYSLDVFTKEKILFWGDVEKNAIRKINLTNGHIQDIITRDIGIVDGLAVEWVGEYIYWTDYQYQRIEMARFNGSFRRVLFEEEVNHPRGIAVDPAEGFVFWTDWGEDPKIERSSLSGENRKTILSSTSQPIHWPNGITTDFIGKKIYWMDAKYDIIVSSDYHGNNKKSLKFKSNIHPFSVAYFRSVLYWSDWSTRTIIKLNTKHPSSLSHFGQLSKYKVLGISLFDPSIQTAVHTSCLNNNGGCSHLCLLKPNGYKCACPNGVALQKDGMTCNEGFDRFLVLADSSPLSRKVMQLPLDATPSHQESLPLAVVPSSPTAVGYDPVEDLVYWSDPGKSAISRATPRGINQRQIIHGVHSEGIAVDFIGRNLYWTSTTSTGGTIEVATLEGLYKKKLHHSNIPRAIIADCNSGSLFWSDWGNPAKIETSKMDGSIRIILVNTTLVWPNGLALDSFDRKLYWVDGKRNVLELIDLDSNRRFTLVSNNKRLIQPYGLTLDKTFVYWTEWNASSVFRANKLSGNNVKQILTGLRKPMDIQAFDKSSTIAGRALFFISLVPFHLFILPLFI